MNDINSGFPHTVTSNGGKPGDERQKKLWDLWARVAEAEKDRREAEQAVSFARNKLTDCTNKQTSATRRLVAAKEALDEMLGVPPAEPREGTVPQ